MNRQLIIINAPPRSGKDTLADLMESESEKVGHFRFKTKLYELMQVLYNISDKDMEYYKNYAEKDDPYCFAHGLQRNLQHVVNGTTQTFREGLIMVSEEVIKPFFGKDYFGNALVEEFLHSGKDIGVVSDGGFPQEVLAVTNRLGVENVHLIRLRNPHVKGFHESGDSRRELPDTLFGSSHTIVNDPEATTLEELKVKGMKVLEEILNG